MALSNEPKARIGLLARARGKVFALVKGLPAGLLRSVSQAEGTLLPSQLFDLGGGECVACVPVVSCSQQIEIRLAESGQLVAQFEITPLQASLASKVNTLSRRREIDAMRSIDKDRLDLRFSVDCLITNFERRIVRTSLDLYGIDPADARRPFDVIVLGEDGQHLSDACALMGKDVSEATEYPGLLRRQASFSSEIPESVPSFFIWVRYADTGETISFEHYDANQVADLKSFWDGCHLSVGDDERYGDWFRSRHRASERDLALQQEAQCRLAVRPSFSLMVRMPHQPTSFHQLLKSVLSQTYDNFELLVLGGADAADAADAASGMRRYGADDPRVRLLEPEGEGIGALDVGMRAATGEFVALLDGECLLEPDALYWYAKAVGDYPETDMIYCDEDRLQNGRFVAPILKPDWDVTLQSSHSYVGHFCAMRKTLLEGADELADCGAVGLRARNVHHVRRVLCHMRSNSAPVPPTCADEVRDMWSGRAPLVSIVIPNYESPDILRTCVESLIGLSTWDAYEIVIVENGSKLPETFALYDELEKGGKVHVVTCEQPNGFNFSKLINCGAAASHGEFLLFLNNDTEVLTPDWLERMMAPMADPSVGCVGTKLLYPDGTVQHVGVCVGRSHGPFHAELLKPGDDPCYGHCAVLPHETLAVTGACLLTRRSAFYAVGGLDEAFPVDYNDVDYCLRVREAGFRVVMRPDAVLRHYESVSRGVEDNARRWCSLVGSLGRFAARWRRFLILGDPYYNKNFLFNDPYHRLDA